MLEENEEGMDVDIVSNGCLDSSEKSFSLISRRGSDVCFLTTVSGTRSGRLLPWLTVNWRRRNDGGPVPKKIHRGWTEVSQRGHQEIIISFRAQTRTEIRGWGGPNSSLIPHHHWAQSWENGRLDEWIVIPARPQGKSHLLRMLAERFITWERRWNSVPQRLVSVAGSGTRLIKARNRMM